MKTELGNRGYALVIVVGFVAVMSILLAAVLTYSTTQMHVAVKQSHLEQALYVAQAGAERAVAYVVNGGDGPWSSSGQVGEGTYVMAIIPAAMPSEAPRTLGGWIKIHPAGSPGQGGNEFNIQLANGDIIDYLTLGEDYEGYTGPAVWVHIKPGGSGNQTDLLVDGVPYAMQNEYTYDIFAACMDVSIYNELVNPTGKAVGKWKLAIATSCASFVVAD